MPMPIGVFAARQAMRARQGCPAVPPSRRRRPAGAIISP